MEECFIPPLLQSALGKMPGFIWSKYPGDKHMIYKLSTKSNSYLGPGTV